MMQDYDLFPVKEKPSTNTSTKSVSAPLQPSQQVVQNILNFAHCCQHITTSQAKLKICLN